MKGDNDTKTQEKCRYCAANELKDIFSHFSTAVEIMCFMPILHANVCQLIVVQVHLVQRRIHGGGNRPL